MHHKVDSLESFKRMAETPEAQTYLLFEMLIAMNDSIEGKIKILDSKVVHLRSVAETDAKKERKVFIMMGVLILLSAFKLIPNGDVVGLIKMLLGAIL